MELDIDSVLKERKFDFVEADGSQCTTGNSELNLPLGSLAQLGEHLPYKQRVSGSIPLTPIGPVV